MTNRAETQTLKWDPILRKEQARSKEKDTDTPNAHRAFITPIFNMSVIDVAGQTQRHSLTLS